MTVETDEVIAHAVKKESSRVVAVKASWSTNSGQVLILAQNWVSPSGRYHSSKCGNDQKATDGSGENEYEIDDSIKKLVADCQSKDEKVGTDNDEGNLEDLLHLLVSFSMRSTLSSENHKIVREQVINQLKSHHKFMRVMFQ